MPKTNYPEPDSGESNIAIRLKFCIFLFYRDMNEF